MSFTARRVHDVVAIHVTEMDIVLDLLEQLASVVDPKLFEDLAIATTWVEETRAWDMPEAQKQEAARALDAARDAIPGLTLRLAYLDTLDATCFANAMLNAAEDIESGVTA